VRTSMDAMLLAIAATVATRSTCQRLYVGAVLAHDGRPFAVGYNGAPRGLGHCLHPLTELAADSAPCTRAVHAEANALVNAALAGASTRGADAYLTHSPCVGCAGLLVNAGIARVVYTDVYRSADGLNLLREAGVTCESAAEALGDTPSRN
jgi:dCMP deaminase